MSASAFALEAPPAVRRLRHWVLVLGDQLDEASSAFEGFDPRQDRLWMAEVAGESTHVPSSRLRTALFLSAMRHFALTLQQRGWPIRFRRLDEPDNPGTLAAALAEDLAATPAEAVVVTAPGDWRVLQDLRRTCAQAGVRLELRDDPHFYTTVRDFAAHAQGRRQLRLEFFYREMRQRHDVLMEDGKPAGGQWNFDADNRESFGAAGPTGVPARMHVEPDAVTREVLALVQARFPGHVGDLSTFGWPVTREEAQQALKRFIDERLVSFGRWQDALWPGQPWLWHAHLSAALNLKLLNPREVVSAAEQAYRDGCVPLASAEGFIRQILGWREYVRGLYWTRMPDYAELNAWQAHEPLPAFYWTGRTDMACLADAIGQTLRWGYAHHIQRLMVTGLYALLLGVKPQAVHAWYLAVYVDAVEWVELPNTLGMSQAADGGLMASKPYIASGAYIQRMSGGALCSSCRFKPVERVGPQACPFTTLYWDFLLRHELRLRANPRVALQVRNLVRLSDAQRSAITDQARALRERSAQDAAAEVA